MPRETLTFSLAHGSNFGGADRFTGYNMYPVALPPGSISEYSLVPRPTTTEFSSSGTYDPTNYDQVQCVLEHQSVIYFLACKDSSGDLDLFSSTGVGSYSTTNSLDTGTMTGDIIDGPSNQSFGGRVPKMVASNTELMILDHAKQCYIYDISGATLTQVTDVDFPSNVQDIAYQDGFFIWLEYGTQTWGITNLNDGLTIGALDYTEANANPDPLTAVVSYNNELWVFGTKSYEVYQNTGNAVFPFVRRQGILGKIGCIGHYGTCIIGDILYWIGLSENGSVALYKSNGYQAEIIYDFDAILDLRFVDHSCSIGSLEYRGSQFLIITIAYNQLSIVYNIQSNSITRWGHSSSLALHYTQSAAYYSQSAGAVSSTPMVNNLLDGDLVYLSNNNTDHDNTNLYCKCSSRHIYRDNSPITVESLDLKIDDETTLPSNNYEITLTLNKATEYGSTTSSTVNCPITFIDSTGCLNKVSIPSLGQSRDWVIDISYNGARVKINDASIRYTVDQD